MKFIPTCEFCGETNFSSAEECLEHEKVCSKNPNAEVVTAILYDDPDVENPQSPWRCPICNAFAFKRYQRCFECGCKIKIPE